MAPLRTSPLLCAHEYTGTNHHRDKRTKRRDTTPDARTIANHTAYPPANVGAPLVTPAPHWAQQTRHKRTPLPPIPRPGTGNDPPPHTLCRPTARHGRHKWRPYAHRRTTMRGHTPFFCAKPVHFSLFITIFAFTATSCGAPLPKRGIRGQPTAVSRPSAPHPRDGKTQRTTRRHQPTKHFNDMLTLRIANHSCQLGGG